MVAAISGDSGTFSLSIKYECDAVARCSLDRHTQPAFEASAGRATPRGPARHPSAVAVQTPTQQGRPRSRPHAVGFEEAMLILELNGRFPDDGGLEPAWRTGLAAFDSPALVARPQ